MNCHRHVSQASIGCCSACGRWVCTECSGGTDDVALACGDACSRILRRREMLEQEQAQSLLVSNWMPSFMPRFGYALAALIAVIPVTMLASVGPGRGPEFVRLVSGLWLLSGFVLVSALVLRPIASRAQQSMERIRAAQGS